MITIIIKSILELINIYLLLYLISFSKFEFKNNNKSGGVFTTILTLIAFSASFIIILLS